MTLAQYDELERLQAKLSLSDGDVLLIARERAQGCGCGLRSVRDLDYDDLSAVIGVLLAIEEQQEAAKDEALELTRG